MSDAKLSFDYGIKDAENLLEYFDAINANPPPENAEVLKRAALVLALTAWETYVEDRVSEGLAKKISVVAGSYAGNFIESRLRLELKQFHTPNSDKTRKIFLDFLEVDVTQGWNWANTDPSRAKRVLNELISKRGDAVHRTKPLNNGSPNPHLVKREELVKAIRFIKDLVNATEAYLNESA